MAYNRITNYVLFSIKLFFSYLQSPELIKKLLIFDAGAGEYYTENYYSMIKEFYILE